MHSFRGVHPRNSAKRSCGLCKQKLSSKRPYRWYQGRPIHEDCFEAEMKKPLHERFRK